MTKVKNLVGIGPTPATAKRLSERLNGVSRQQRRYAAKLKRIAAKRAAKRAAKED